MNVDICARSGPCAFPTGRPFQFDGIFSELVLGKWIVSFIVSRDSDSAIFSRFNRISSLTANRFYIICLHVLLDSIEIFFKRFIQQRRRSVFTFQFLLIIILFVINFIKRLLRGTSIARETFEFENRNMKKNKSEKLSATVI